MLGKVPHGGHCAAGDHALLTMVVGPSALLPKRFGMACPGGSHLCDKLVKEGFQGIFQFIQQLCVYHEGGRGAVWRI